MTEQIETTAPAETREWWQGKFILALRKNDDPSSGLRSKIGAIFEVIGVYGGRLITEIRMADGNSTSTAFPVQFFEIDSLISSVNPARDGSRMFGSYGDAMAFAVVANADTPMGNMTVDQIESYRSSLVGDNAATNDDRTRRNA
ncbi:hypothetical protein QD336_00025 [Rhizobium sp. BR 250]